MADERLIDGIAAAICRTNPNYGQYHFPGDKPRKWRTPGGAIWDTTALGDRSAEHLRVSARAILAAIRNAGFAIVATEGPEFDAAIFRASEAFWDEADGFEDAMRAALRAALAPGDANG